MDTKALARSKRAHSLHHSKKHKPHQVSRTPSNVSGSKNPTGNQSREKPSESQGSRLPLNRESYVDDLDLGLEEAGPTEFVVPKSKGGDYAQLISDAKAQSPANYSSDFVPFFDDVIYDFQDFGPVLAAKGQSILSWIADDSFEFEGKGSTSHETPFLSLDMNGLAAQLSKAKLSERVFIELPVELLDDELLACTEDTHDPQTCTSSAETDSRASSIGYNQQLSENVRQYHKSASTSEEGLKPVKQTKYDSLQSQGTNTSIAGESISSHILDSTTDNPPTFEAASAEAELDMLLESLSASSIGNPSTGAASGETVKKWTPSMKPEMVVKDIDDAIDNLLDETSDLTGKDGKQLTGSNTKVIDDFDSWLDTI